MEAAHDGKPADGQEREGSGGETGCPRETLQRAAPGQQLPRLTPRTLSEYLLPGTKMSESTQISHKYKANSSLMAHKLSSS